MTEYLMSGPEPVATLCGRCITMSFLYCVWQCQDPDCPATDMLAFKGCRQCCYAFLDSKGVKR